MTTLSLTLQTPHAAQQKVIDEAARFNVVCCGRRWGKTVLGMDRVVHPALESRPTAWFSPSYKSLQETWRDLRTLLLPVTTSANHVEHRIELITGGSITMWSLDGTDTADLARGRKYAMVVVDEAAVIRDFGNIWQNVIRPSLADLIGGAWFLSTPRGLNYFKTLYDRGQDPLRKDWASWRMPTSANPYISKLEVEAARQDMSEGAFSQEFEADFMSGEGSVFRKIRDAIVLGHFVPQSGHDYCIGVDWGRVNDFSVFVVVDRTTKTVVEVMRSNQVDYTIQRGRLMALYAKWSPIQTIVEANSIGQPLIESLWRDGLPLRAFNTTNQSKARIIESLSLSFEREEIHIPDDPVLIAELEAFESERLQSGMIRYAAPAGLHDDCVMSLALAWEGVKRAPYLLTGSVGW